MLELRPLNDNDIPLVEAWLNKEHVKRWYEIPHMQVTIADWMYEIGERNGEFKWLNYFVVQWQGQPIGLCQYYKCADSDEDFGTLPLANAYGIDYLIGEEAYLGQGLGKGMVSLLVDKIFTLPGAQLVTADIDKNNKASAKTLLACGFTLLDEASCRYYKQKAST
ncbi:GNAT family N-acetyltransferase [uncultured Phascolarctobacterium sp.]|uniref:GNAT family N-acetyltransferase n=1 Tax=Phascolarctobacterium sp. TaxID=2049039 RepID=UPI0025CD85EA|nr:GNAT family N-acetyltransferase [uncultured Phascolarctobacterium sp.]